MWKEWVRERGTNPPTFCPIERETGCVIVGMMYVSDEPPNGEKVVGEFWYDDNFDIHVALTSEG